MTTIYFDKEKLVNYLGELLNELYKKETILFENQVHERSAVFRYGLLLDKRLKTVLRKLEEKDPSGIVVDSEYNLMTDPYTSETSIKEFQFYDHVYEQIIYILNQERYISKEHTKNFRRNNSRKKDHRPKKFMPDLLVHRRGITEGRYNHIMMEFKYCTSIYSSGNKDHLRELISDIVKLSLGNGEQFDYELTAFVRLCHISDCQEVIPVDFKGLTGQTRHEKIAKYVSEIQRTCHQNK